MSHTISVTAQGQSAGALAQDLADVPGVEVVERRATDQLALDPASVSLLIAGIGSVNALIGALATVWTEKIRKRSGGDAPAPAQTVVHIHTDADEVRVTVGPDGTVVETSASLPAAVEEITDIHIAAAPAPG
jgi:hypothetical protein